MEYDEEEDSSSDDGKESEDDGELGECKDDKNVNADRIVMRELQLQLP